MDILSQRNIEQTIVAIWERPELTALEKGAAFMGISVLLTCIEDTDSILEDLRLLWNIIAIRECNDA
jgi:hypothetical protein